MSNEHSEADLDQILDCYSEEPNLHLSLSDDILMRLDDASSVRCGWTREDVATAAILWALRNFEEELEFTLNALQESSRH